MKFLATAALIGAVTAAATPQQFVLQNPLKNVGKAAAGTNGEESAWSKLVSPLADGMKNMGAEAKAAWDEVSMLFPEQMDAASFLSKPKPHTRRPDSHWDHIVKGEDVQAMTINVNGKKEKAIDGHLEDYQLRAKKVDPAKLGVDSVKQYSGYLDDNANDKHLFYCKSLVNTLSSSVLIIHRVLRVSQ